MDLATVPHHIDQTPEYDPTEAEPAPDDHFDQSRNQ